VAAAALQEGLVSPEEHFIDKGYVEVSGRRINNWTDEPYGSVSFTEIIKESINTGFVQVGLRLGGTKLNDYARAFGFGRPTGIEVPGEEEGIMFKTDEMRQSDVATMSIGQSIAVTPLQLLTAVSAIANDGVLLKPHIIKEIYNADGTLYSAKAIEVIRQVISPDVAHTLTMLLEKVISEGGGKKAAVKGYRFAGKTGTAERLLEGGTGYEAGHYIASFVGFGPVEEPQVAILVMIDDPVGFHYYGGDIAAPIASEILTQVVRYLNIRPQIAGVLSPQTKSDSASVASISPDASMATGKVAVPNVVGKTIREVGEILNKAGLGLVPTGTGIAITQSIEPNTMVNPGTEVSVYFEMR
jgi:stage V sporulation protein D (sporulation-specific penicillin-binding protein)